VASVPAVRQTARAPADSPMQWHAGDSSFHFHPGIISSLNGTAPSTEGKLVRIVGLYPESAATVLAGRLRAGRLGFGSTTGSAHYRRPPARIEYIVATVLSSRWVSRHPVVALLCAGPVRATFTSRHGLEPSHGGRRDLIGNRGIPDFCRTWASEPRVRRNT